MIFLVEVREYDSMNTCILVNEGNTTEALVILLNFQKILMFNDELFTSSHMVL